MRCGLEQVSDEMGGRSWKREGEGKGRRGEKERRSSADFVWQMSRSAAASTRAEAIGWRSKDELERDGNAKARESREARNCSP